MPLLDRRLLFVTGKGGVGKTAITAALGLLAASRGKRTLLCEVDAKGDLADVFETSPDTFEARELGPNLWSMAMSTEESLREYLRTQVGVPFLARVGPLARSLDFVANAAPGVKEILTVGKLAWEVRERHYDLVVVDAPATGHVVSQLSAPQAIAELVKVGRVRDQTAWMADLLADSDSTAAVLVCTPEEMPVVETLELIERIRAETEVDIAAVVVNKVLPELFGRGEEEVFELLGTPEVAGVLSGAAGGDAEPLLRAARLAVTLRRTRAEHLTRLRDGVGSLPLLYLPHLFSRSHGVRATRTLAESLGEELGQELRT